jgi:hypothetical protein
MAMGPIDARKGNAMSIYEDTASVIREAERLVIGSRLDTRWRHAKPTLDAIVHVPWFILAGLQERLASFALAAVLMPVWWCILLATTWLPGGPSGADLRSSHGLIVAALLATGSVIFRLPSHSTRFGIRPPQIAQLASHIRSIASGEASIKLLQSGVATMNAVWMQRITRIGWMLGVYWGGLVWATSHWVFAAEIPEPLKNEATSRILAAFLTFLFFGVGASSYAAAARMVMQTIDFAFLDASDRRCSEKD